MKSYWDLLPNDLQSIIIRCRAANIIQDKTIKMFQKKYGEDWKQKIHQKIHQQSQLVYDLDYYCYRMGINDPWYDYCDDPKYAY